MSSNFLGFGALIIALSAQAVEMEARKAEPDEKDLRASLLKAAARVDEVKLSQGQKPGNLLKRVEATLKRPPPAKPAAWEKNGILKHLRIPTGRCDLALAVRSGSLGLLADTTPDGIEAAYQERLREKHQGGKEILRLCGLVSLASDLKMNENIIDSWMEMAVIAARTWLGQHPEDAEAHALLAEALLLEGDSSLKEALKELDMALVLDPKCPRAMMLHLERRVAHISASLFSNSAPRWDEPAMDFVRFLRRLYDTPPSMERIEAFNHAWVDIEKSAAEVRAVADTDSLMHFRSAATLIARNVYAGLAEAAGGGLVRSFDDFQALANRLQLTSQGAALKQVEWMPAMSRIPEIEQAHGQHIMAAAFIPVVFSLFPNGHEAVKWPAIQEAKRIFFEKCLERARILSLKDDSVEAAKTCELMGCVQIFLGMMSERPYQPQGLLKRAITLDPWRYRALDFIALSVVSSDPAAAMAAMQIRLEVLHNYSSHYQLAAAATKLEDWKTCLAQLGACLKHKPDDLQALNGQIAIKLCESQTPERLREVSVLFDKTRQVYSTTQDKQPAEVVEDFVVNYFLFLCLNKEWAAAVELMTHLQNNGRISEQTATELLALCPP